LIDGLILQAANPVRNLPFQWTKPLHTAAVCVYPTKVQTAVTTLKKLNKTNEVKVASGRKQNISFDLTMYLTMYLI
jgi:deoxyribose-phosphate aldolase